MKNVFFQNNLHEVLKCVLTTVSCSCVFSRQTQYKHCMGIVFKEVLQHSFWCKGATNYFLCAVLLICSNQRGSDMV